GVMDDEVDELGVGAEDDDAEGVGRRAAERAAGAAAAGRSGEVGDFEAPVPSSGTVDGELAGDGGALAGILADDDGERVGAGESTSELRGAVTVGTVAEPDGIAGMNGGGLIESGLEIPGTGDAAVAGRGAGGRDIVRGAGGGRRRSSRRRSRVGGSSGESQADGDGLDGGRSAGSRDRDLAGVVAGGQAGDVGGDRENLSTDTGGRGNGKP